MEATVTKDWETLSSFVYDRVSGKDTSKLTENDYDALNKDISKMIASFDVESMKGKVRQIMELNILDKKVSFDIFYKIPPLWYAYYGSAIIIDAEDSQGV